MENPINYMNIKEYDLKDHKIDGKIFVDDNNHSIPNTLELNGINTIELKGTLDINSEWYPFTITMNSNAVVLLFDTIEYYDNEKDLTEAKEFQVLQYCIFDFLSSTVNRPSYYNDDKGKYVIDVDNTLMLGTGLNRSVTNHFKYNKKHYEIYLNNWSITKFSDAEHPHKLTTSKIIEHLAEYL